jgi:hypothetical protein
MSVAVAQASAPPSGPLDQGMPPSNTTTTTLDQGVTATPTVQAPNEIKSINDLILSKAANVPDTPLIAYPDSPNGLDNWIEYTAKDLDLYADEAAKELSHLGLKPKVSSPESQKCDPIYLITPV